MTNVLNVMNFTGITAFRSYLADLLSKKASTRLRRGLALVTEEVPETSWPPEPHGCIESTREAEVMLVAYIIIG